MVRTTKRKLERLSFPIPPLAGQHRVVALVDESMALCDESEARIGAADGTSGLLLDSLLRESPGSQEAASNGGVGAAAGVGA